MRILTSLLSILWLVQVNAQGVITAEVYNQNTKEPIEFANLRVFNVADSSVIGGGFSDSEGFIRIDELPVGKHYAILSAFGFKKNIIESIKITSKKSKIKLGRLLLKSEVIKDLDEVTIKAESEVLQTSFDKRVYNTEEDMTSQGGDITDILNNIPSVEVDNDGNISLRGSGNVTILIDGRPSAMSQGAEGALDGIPASSVERIEIITNPSAKYDPDGTAGLINIVLKKNKLRGSNTKVDLSGSTGHLYNGSINFNARNEKVNFYSNYSFRYREGYRNNMNDRISLINDTLVNLFQDRSGTDTRRSHTAKVGSDFFFAKNQVIGISASGTYSDRIRTGNQYNLELFNNELNRYWNRLTYDPRNRMSIDVNADYKLDFKENKGDFLVVLTQSLGDSESEGIYEERYYRPDGSPFENNRVSQYQSMSNNSFNFTGSADLQRNVSENFRYETGVKTFINQRFRSNYLEYYDSISGDILPDSNVINDFSFDEQIFAGYGIIAHKINKFRYQLGIRLEQAFTQPRLITTNEDFENNYFSYFPSGHLIYGDEKMGELSLSYSRRINRPNSWSLNPFPVYSDPLNLRQGNPALQPEYINSFEFGYQKDWDKLTLSGSLYFRQTVDKIQRIRQFFPNGVSINSFANIDESYDFGVEAVAVYSPFSWWKNVVSFNGYEKRLAANVNGVNLRNSGFSWSTKLNSTFSLFDGTTSIQVNAQYIAPTFTVQGFYQRYAGIDIGINRSFYDKKLVVGLRLTDLLNEQGFYLEINDGQFTQQSMYKWETRRLYLNVSYKFGKIESGKEKKKPEIILRESDSDL